MKLLHITKYCCAIDDVISFDDATVVNHFKCVQSYLDLIIETLVLSGCSTCNFFTALEISQTAFATHLT